MSEMKNCPLCNSEPARQWVDEKETPGLIIWECSNNICHNAQAAMPDYLWNHYAETHPVYELRTENARLTAELEESKTAVCEAAAHMIRVTNEIIQMGTELTAARKWAATWKMLAKVWAQMDVYEVYPALKRQFNTPGRTLWPGADWRKRK